MKKFKPDYMRKGDDLLSVTNDEAVVACWNHMNSEEDFRAMRRRILKGGLYKVSDRERENLSYLDMRIRKGSRF